MATNKDKGTIDLGDVVIDMDPTISGANVVIHGDSPLQGAVTITRPKAERPNFEFGWMILKAKCDDATSQLTVPYTVLQLGLEEARCRDSARANPKRNEVTYEARKFKDASGSKPTRVVVTKATTEHA